MDTRTHPIAENVKAKILDEAALHLAKSWAATTSDETFLLRLNGKKNWQVHYLRESGDMKTVSSVDELDRKQLLFFTEKEDTAIVNWVKEYRDLMHRIQYPGARLPMLVVA